MKHRSMREPYVNQILKHQEKFVREHAPLKPHAMENGKNSYYEIYQCLHMGTGGDEFRSGEFDPEVCWRCDCGAEIDCREPRCRRCGAVGLAEIR